MVLLDRAEYSVDGSTFEKEADVLKIDTWCRKQFVMPPITGKIAKQPWCIKEQHPRTITLRYRIYSDIEVSCRVAFEECAGLSLNGSEISTEAQGYYVDRDIHTTVDFKLKKGENILDAQMVISEKVGLEPMHEVVGI